ncbi:MAG: magnesium transporter CorA family protein [Acidimicrobiales bacterium]|nr:magnesium transporter CorA family protein [Acidimicrobiales bacterium]
MIECRWYPGGRADPELVPLEGLDRCHAGDGAADALVWIDLSDADRAEIDAVAARLGIDPAVMAAVGRRRPRNRILPWGDVRHAAVPAGRLVGEQLHIGILEIVFSSWFVVTLRWGDVEERTEPYPLDDVRAVYRSSRQAGGPSGVGGLLWALFDQLAEDALDAVEAIDDQLDRAEETVFNDDTDQSIPRGLFGLRRDIAALRRATSPQRDVISALLRGERALLGEPSYLAIERVYDHVLRVVELIEGQRDLLSGLLDAHLSISANRTNEVMKRTSSWGAILVVATLVVGYYGMNFPGMPEFAWQYGWAWALALMVGVTVALYLVFKRKDWL